MSNEELELFAIQLIDILESGAVEISNIKPSDWVEQNVMMTDPFPGMYRYSLTPYCREIIDCFAADHPMLWISIMKGAQIGLSAGVIIPILLWMIKNNPCRTYFLVGSPELVEKATEKLDIGIDGANLRTMIKPQAMRRRAQKSGDTNFKKEFSGGYIHIGSANNHKDIRDVSLRMGLFDDFESVKMQSKESGSTRKMLEQRFAAFADRHKIAYISTPELDEKSNIKEAYELGDQRKYLIPCPCCGVFIEWKWTVTDGEITGGIVWDEDPLTGVLVEGSVRYKCQSCGEKFSDKDKHEMLNQGYWQPTATPSKAGYYSYHISALYAPIGMYGWEHYVNDYIEANPKGQPRNESLWKTFVNVVLGETYKQSATELKATAIMRNASRYYPWTVPITLSRKDGNGEIVLITMSADLGGIDENDVRLDYEIVAHTETGSTYSISHGSIGTFKRGDAGKVERIKWSAVYGSEYCVWDDFDKIIGSPIVGDDGKQWYIAMTGIDTGFLNTHVYAFMDRSPNYNKIVGVRGKKEHNMLRKEDTKVFTISPTRKDTYNLQVGYIKDDIAQYMQLVWDKDNNKPQPPNFMNFPQPNDGLYGLENFFEHFESEHRTVVELKSGETQFKWEKKSGAIKSQNNHHFDTRVYNMALRDIVVAMTHEYLKDTEKYKGKIFLYPDYVEFAKMQ